MCAAIQSYNGPKNMALSASLVVYLASCVFGVFFFFLVCVLVFGTLFSAACAWSFDVCSFESPWLGVA